MALASEPEDLGRSYSLKFIMANPIPAKCNKCKRLWIEGNGNGAIFAPTLEQCACFYCHGALAPLYPDAYKLRLKNLHLYVEREQPGLFDDIELEEATKCLTRAIPNAPTTKLAPTGRTAQSAIAQR